MKRWTLFLAVFLGALQSCGYQEKEAQLVKRERQIAEKQQALVQWEQRLTLMEKQLLEKEKKQLRDSTAVIDSLLAQPVTGKWIIKMRCTETSCSGSAIGDAKTEIWEIAYSNRAIIINAFAGNKLSRIYNGSFFDNRLEAANGQPGSESVMRVRLELKDGKMEGIREVERTDCQTRYTLTAERQK